MRAAVSVNRCFSSLTQAAAEGGISTLAQKSARRASHSAHGSKCSRTSVKASDPTTQVSPDLSSLAKCEKTHISRYRRLTGGPSTSGRAGKSGVEGKRGSVRGDRGG